MVKLYKVEMYVLDFDDYSIQTLKDNLRDNDYIITFKEIQKRNINNWSDEHELNQIKNEDKFEEYFR